MEYDLLSRGVVHQRVGFSFFLVQVKDILLHAAASAGHHKTCELLLEKGAHVDSQDDVSATFPWASLG